MNKKAIIIIIIILMVPGFIIYSHLHNAFTLQDGEVGVDSGEIYIYDGGSKGTGYAMYTNGASSEITYYDSDYCSLINLDLTNLTFKNNISKDKFLKDIRKFNLGYSVNFYDENGSSLTSYHVSMLNDPPIWDYTLWTTEFIAKQTKNQKTITLNYHGNDKSVVKINDTNMVILDKNEPNDFSTGKAINAKYATVTINFYGDHKFFNWNDPNYRITSEKIYNIESATLERDWTNNRFVSMNSSNI